MSAYTVTKNDGKTLVTTVINANDAADIGGNPITLKIPDGFSVDRASQIYGPSNEAKNATQVVPANPLPDSVPFSGPAPTASPADDNDLRIDLAASSATVFIMRKD
ncbi:hypothetical protein ACMZ29_07250 [Brevibacterium casei]|uniref:hypothetical protein n=1 Tax=Brevibacterium casei TaxID=33889 RepID=UPI0039F00807